MKLRSERVFCCIFVMCCAANLADCVARSICHYDKFSFSENWLSRKLFAVALEKLRVGS